MLPVACVALLAVNDSSHCDLAPCNQKVAGSVTRAQEERRKVQGGVLKSMKELETKCGLMKSSKVRGF